MECKVQVERHNATSNGTGGGGGGGGGGVTRRARQIISGVINHQADDPESGGVQRPTSRIRIRAAQGWSRRRQKRYAEAMSTP
ncbi:hypothetical protein JYU34_012367 [Plutella xylostella]|uniref:Uncharacterized protein n=1 Tax=Plutella xylostella TaxID=51655 RepID=A0ABQ7QB92_PLUXY|nr:hypothetical protein JYU34_012367 [Plutella xylostella]